MFRFLGWMAHARGAGRRAVLRTRPAPPRRATNYLDIEGTIWLYDYLERYPRTAVIISHDRDLLDECVDHILHLDRGKLSIYRGGYTSFARQVAEKRVLQSKAKAKQDAERAHLQSFVDRFKAKATKARQAQSRVKRLAKMEIIASVIEDDVPAFRLPSPERPLSPPIVAMERVQAGYPDRIVLSGLNLSLAPTTGSRCWAPTATASPPSASSSAGACPP